MKQKQHYAESFFPTVTPTNWSALDRINNRKKKTKVSLSERILSKIRRAGF